MRVNIPGFVVPLGFELCRLITEEATDRFIAQRENSTVSFGNYIPLRDFKTHTGALLRYCCRATVYLVPMRYNADELTSIYHSIAIFSIKEGKSGIKSLSSLLIKHGMCLLLHLILQDINTRLWRLSVDGSAPKEGRFRLLRERPALCIVQSLSRP